MVRAAPVCKDFFLTPVEGGQEWGWGSQCDILVPFSSPNEDLGAHLVPCQHFKDGETAAQKGIEVVTKALASRGDFHTCFSRHAGQCLCLCNQLRL